MNSQTTMINHFGSIYISDKSISEIPILYKDSIINGNFHCGRNDLVTLINSPKIVNEDFDCRDNKSLISLKGSPKNIGVHFNCKGTNIKTLHSNTTYVGKVFDVSNTPISSLEGAPEWIRTLVLSNNKNLTNLKDVHKHLKYCNHITIDSPGCYIESHILGLILVDGLLVINNFGINCMGFPEACYIINKYLKLEQGKNSLLACQQELIEAGLEQYAQL